MKLCRTLLLVAVGFSVTVQLSAGPTLFLDPDSLVELLRNFRNDPGMTYRDLFEGSGTWQATPPSPGPATPTPTVTPTPTPPGPSWPVGVFARVGKKTIGSSQGAINADDVQITFSSGNYVYRDFQVIPLELGVNRLYGSVTQSGFIREVTLTLIANDRYSFVDRYRESAAPHTLTAEYVGALYPQSQWGPFTGYYRGTRSTTNTTTDRQFPCITNDIGGAINFHLLEIDGQIRMLTNTFALAVAGNFDADNPASYAAGGAEVAMWAGIYPPGNFVGCAPAGTASQREDQFVTLSRDATGANMTGTYHREVAFTDGTFETVTQSITAMRQNPF